VQISPVTISDPQPILVKSVPPAHGHPVRLVASDWMKLLVAVFGHLIVMTSLAVSAYVGLDRRLTISETDQTMMRELLSNSRADLKELQKITVELQKATLVIQTDVKYLRKRQGDPE